ncbi:MAG: DUF4430 domain-containing protein [Candidatus Zixiibacteriota bacterium]|nr:MAG: DUF4430 domain-containing protein [candidate division Zixibacteria bacterium]
MMVKPYFVAISLILLTSAIWLGAGCSESGDSETASTPDHTDSLAANQPFDSLVIELNGIDSLTVFDVLLKAHEVDYFSTAAGVLVRGIDSVTNSRGFFWLYSVNYSMPRVAADRYMTRHGDTVRWHYRRISK